MGWYSTLFIQGIEVFSIKYEIDPMLMTLFRPDECFIRHGNCKDVAPHLLTADHFNGDEENEYLLCESSVQTLRERLELIGFTSAFMQKQWDNWRTGALREIDAEADGTQMLEQRALETLTWEHWTRLIRPIWKDDTSRTRMPARPDLDSDPQVIMTWYMGTQKEMWFETFLCQDSRMVVWAFCHDLDPDTRAIYDLSDLLWAGEFESAEEGAELAKSYMDGYYSKTQRIIVLTEGKSDQRVIEKALALLRPAVKDFFSFLDFEMMRVEGGAQAVINIMKAFIATGVVNRLVALLDNDTAAHSAVLSARLMPLPENVKLLYLPELPIAKGYPTIGPGGMKLMDINGLACSMEMFFGVDVLKDDSGALTPIKWKGYDPKVGRYQGEIENKPKLQERYLIKLDTALTNRRNNDGLDWEPMQLVIESLVTAFDGVPPLHFRLHPSD